MVAAGYGHTICISGILNCFKIFGYFFLKKIKKLEDAIVGGSIKKDSLE